MQLLIKKKHELVHILREVSLSLSHLSLISLSLLAIGQMEYRITGIFSRYTIKKTVLTPRLDNSSEVTLYINAAIFTPSVFPSVAYCIVSTAGMESVALPKCDIPLQRVARCEY